MRVFESLDEFKAAKGEPLGPSDWITVTQDQINGFAESTHDHQWIHTDPERAKDGPFGTVIAHGYLTLSLLPAFIESLYEIRGLKMGVNYGANKVRFPDPVPVDSRLRSTASL
jgi:acyl dehydratase